MVKQTKKQKENRKKDLIRTTIVSTAVLISMSIFYYGTAKQNLLLQATGYLGVSLTIHSLNAKLMHIRDSKK